MLKMRGNRVGVEKLKKSSKRDGTFVVLPDAEEYMGIIKLVGDSASKDLIVGQKVFFGDKIIQQVRMAGSEICVMDDVNVLAISDEEQNTPAV